MFKSDPQAHKSKSRSKFFITVKLVLQLFIAVFFIILFTHNSYVSADEMGGLSGYEDLASTMNSIQVFDSTLKSTVQGIDINRRIEEAKKAAEQLSGSRLFQATLGRALNTIAYDTATWLGSGGEGQKPLFITEGWGEYLSNVADNAAGGFIDEVNKNWENFDICEPDLATKIVISRGLISQAKPEKPSCTFTEMKKNWEEELKNPNFLFRFQDMFNPQSNDLGVALTLQTKLLEEKEKEQNQAELQLSSKGEWIDLRNVAGYLEGTPDWARLQSEDILKGSVENIGQWTGSILIDAANIFLNQLAITAIDTLMRNLAGGKSYSSSGGNSGVYNYEAGPVTGGIEGAKDSYRKLIEPRFNERGDYNILTELSVCPNPTKAGPTNCVLTDRFRQAVENKLTVAEAISGGYLNANGIFGFTADGLEPPYTEGYPYRTILILRKFRIVPVGWEAAAQAIKDGKTGIDRGAVSLGDLMACFDPGDEYTGNSEGWCVGLVDPNWVLKAPQNYCKREGPGPVVVSEQVIGQGEGSQLAVSRNTNYCADEQSCIQENRDGSCKLYGYCSEERRTWNFGDNYCEPLYNTCQTFRGPEGQSVSYLENTLDYGICSLDNAGCAGYCRDYNAATADFSCSTTTGRMLVADHDIEECDSDVEGCHEFIRTKAGLGANLLKNASFENIALTDTIDDGITDTFDVWGPSGLAVSGGFQSSVGLQLAGGLSTTTRVGPNGFSLAGQILTLSLMAKDCSEGDDIRLGNGSGISSTTITAGDSWRSYQVSHDFPPSTADNQVNIAVTVSGSCTIDAIKLEFGGQATAWSDYREEGLVYEKLAPAYLGCTGNSTSPECQPFVRECGPNWFGCQLFTSGTDGLSVPAQVTNMDYCPEQCVGYDTYIMSDSNFDSQSSANFIPATARGCSAQTAGCDEFTNLDKIGEGAEAREYYSDLKQCTDPKAPLAGTTCEEFYTWEGSAETGYQLRVFQLAAIAEGSGFRPYVVTSGTYDGLECNASTYDLENNPMCREFYDKRGNQRYAFYPYIVTCSSDCHPYRRTEKNILPTISEAVSLCQADCGGIAGCLSTCVSANCSSDSNVRTCDLGDDRGAVYCKNGGLWRSDHQACLYMAIPNEGVKCSAGQAGCREYSGNTGNNTRIVTKDNFEGSLQEWQGDGGTTLSLSNNALMVGGNSLYASGGTHNAYKTVGTLVRPNHTYVVTFLAQVEDAGGQISVSLGGVPFGSVSFTTDDTWEIKELNLNKFDIEVTDDTRLTITGTGNFFIDDVKLTEVVDRYFLVKNSWQTPDVCYEDVFGNYQGTLFNLGCDIYTDRESSIHYLHSFNRLCPEPVVGCELMIDTQNSSDYHMSGKNGGEDGDCSADGRDCITVPADSYRFVVYDPDKLCNSTDKGCELLGRQEVYDNQYVFHNPVYLKNDPDKYSSILCQDEAIGCEAWKTGDYTAYFKDPGDQTCEWRQAQATSTPAYGWFKKSVKRCDEDINETDPGYNVIETNNADLYHRVPLEAQVCQSNSDCLSNRCILDRNDYLCADDNPPKTIGYGSTGQRIYQPMSTTNDYWAGLCPANQAGCTEYIDPVSRFMPNLLFNPTLGDLDEDGSFGDDWENPNSAPSREFDVKPNTLYRFGGRLNSVTASLECGNSLYELNSENELVGLGVDTVTIDLNPFTTVSRLIYSGWNDKCRITLNHPALALFLDQVGVVEFRPAAVDYQLRQDIDRSSCNGTVNNEAGCVLFNERVRLDNDGYQSFVWDADLTYDDGSGVSPSRGSDDANDSNALISVRPDRDCSEWLACRSYIKDQDGNNVCFDLAACNSVDDNGLCDNYVSKPVVNQTLTPVNSGTYQNMTGYSMVGYNGNSFKADYLPLGAMSQYGEAGIVQNGSFELVTATGYPLGWKAEDSSGVWNKSMFVAVDNPAAIREECISPDCGYRAPDGKSFLKLGTEFSAVSEYIDIFGGETYSITAYMNTLGLNKASATLSIQQFNNTGDLIIENLIFEQQPGNGWQMHFGSITVNSSAIRLRIKLSASSAAALGNFYYDDITLKPSLQVRTDWRVPQSCRLYPDASSLSCDYYDSSGIRHRGWYGYCLEYDRYPGQNDACIMWWPVDKVKGEGIDEGAGYSGRTPLYYTIGTQTLSERSNPPLNYNFSTTNDFAHIFVPASDFKFQNKLIESVLQSNAGALTSLEIHATCRSGSFTADASNDYAAGCHGTRCSNTSDSFEYLWNNWFSRDNCEDGGDSANTSRVAGIKAVFEDVGGYEVFKGVDVYVCHSDQNEDDGLVPLTGLYVDASFVYASRIVQTVTPAGQNKYWSARVNEGSNFQSPCQGYSSAAGLVNFDCDYTSDATPFGSIVPPLPVENPEDWDGMKFPGKQPLFYMPAESNLARMGQIHTQANVQRLFAQSYGVWEWGVSPVGECNGGTNDQANCLAQDCPGGSCVANGPTVCTNSANNGDPCEVSICGAGICMDTATSSPEDAMRCNGTGELCCGSTGPSLIPVCANQGICSGGTAAGAVCNVANNDCPGGVCGYDGVESYVATSTDWVPPQNLCTDPSRSSGNDLCGNPPEVRNIQVNGQSGHTLVSSGDYVPLTFNSLVDPQQEPLVAYTVEWGDDSVTTVSGVEMRGRPLTGPPHTLYHIYSYWELKASGVADCYDAGECPDSSMACCTIVPSVKIKDNWGWCNNGSDGIPCPANTYVDYPGLVVVTER